MDTGKKWMLVCSLHAVLTMELLWLWMWGSTLLMLPHAPPWDLPGWQKFQEINTNCSLRSVQEQAGRRAKFFVQSLSQLCPWKNKDAKLWERRVWSSRRENWAEKQYMSGWGLADKGWDGGGLYLPTHFKATSQIVILFLDMNNEYFLHFR